MSRGISAEFAEGLLEKARSRGLVAPADQRLPKVFKVRVPNKWENRYAIDILEPRRRVGEIHHYEFEALKLRVGIGAYYTPDWVAWRQDGRVEIHEVKGFWREAAKVRWKAVQDRYRGFIFVAMTIKGGVWVPA